MDDEIIYSWCFNFVECFVSTPSAEIIVLVDILQCFSSLTPSSGFYEVNYISLILIDVSISF